MFKCSEAIHTILLTLDVKRRRIESVFKLLLIHRGLLYNSPSVKVRWTDDKSVVVIAG